MLTEAVLAIRPEGANAEAMARRSVLSSRPEAERKRVASDLRAIQKIYDDAATAAAAAEASREFTALGLAEAVKRVVGTAHGALKPHEAFTTKLATSAAATREKAHQAPESFQRTPAVEREIRDRLVGMEPLQINAKYYDALEQRDWDFILAVEHAPKAFALLTPEMRETGAAMKLLSSPFASQLAEEEAVADIYRSTVGAVRTELARLAERYGADFSEANQG
jgi:hypothetical protein